MAFQRSYNLRSRHVPPVRWEDFITGEAKNDLRKVPRHLRTAELCRSAVGAHSANVASVPRPLLSPEICIRAATDGYIKDIPESHRTAGVCIAAMNASGTNIRWIPRPILSEELCLAALSFKVPEKRCSLHDIPVDLRSPLVCDLAVSQRGSDLCAVPAPLKTPELCHTAMVREDHTNCALSEIPESMRTREICDAAYARNKLCYIDIPEDLKQFYVPAVRRVCGSPRQRSS